MENKRILIIDDESSLTQLCKMFLETMGDFTVCEENRGLTALATAQAFRPDVILLDCNLPDKNGREIAAELQADPDLNSIPVVFFTGSVSKEEAAASGVHGRCPALAKPFQPTELIECVSRALGLVVAA
jgi:CheY-like chemotaxis protein